MIQRRLLAVATIVALAATEAFTSRPALADAPVTLVVPFPAGGPTDKLARDLSAALGAALRQTVIIENVGGAGGTLGATKVAKAAPDGRTLLLHHIGMATSPALYRSLPFQPLEDFEFLGMINEVPMTVIGRPTLAARDFAELVKWLRAHRGKVSLANAGLGAASHLCGLLFQQSLALSLTTVSYKGTGPAMSDLLGGHVDILCDQTTNTAEQIESGRVKGYAVTTLAPLPMPPALARLPTLDSQGLKGFSVAVWHALYAPKGTPAATVERINLALRAALQDPEFARRQAALGAVVIQDDRLSPAGHKRFLAAEIDKWAPAIKAAGQYAD